jgi:hypothetical protein
MTFVGHIVNLPSGHIAGIPVEETLLSLGPVLFLTAGVALATFRARLRRVRRRRALAKSGRTVNIEFPTPS